jgi:HD-like signal output (HDOD) protein
MQDDYSKRVLERLQSGYGLPSLSLVAIKLIELASEDTCSAHDLAALIEKDPSLTVRVLKLANSAFFKSFYPATTVQHAIMRIGFHQLRVLALSLSLRDTFPLGRTGQIDYEQFWRTSLYQGLLAKSLAQQLKACDPEEAFVAGLILEIGFLIFFDLYMKGKEEAMKISFYPLELLLSWEKERFGVNHREIGEIALRYWKFPGSIIASQSFPASEEQTELGGLSRVCRIAHELSALICHPDADFQSIFHAVASGFDVSPDTINEAVIASLKEVDEIAETLKVEVEGEKDMLSLLEKAHNTLSLLSDQVMQQQSAISTDNLPSFETLKGREGEKETITHTLEAVAHEIRNPLTAVGGFARRLAKTMDPSSDSWKYVEAILEGTKRLEQSLNEMGQTFKNV